MNIFTKHPREVGLNYFQHFLFAFSVVFKLLTAVFCCTIHAFFPFLFTTTTSRIVSGLNGQIVHRKNHESPDN
jgi:hypothetical protein